MTDANRIDDQEKSGLNRRQFVTGTTCFVGMTGMLSASSFACAMDETSLILTTATAPKPVAYVWMGQILLDSTGQERPYVPPATYYCPGS